MLILISSACTGAALGRSRAIVDQYLERVGERSWRGHLSEAGFKRLRQELAAAASKSTAIAAHLVVTRKRMELQWIVGSARRFAETGQISTYEGGAYKKYLASAPSRQIAHRELGLVVELAALWHDIGKANAEFQEKLRHGVPSADTVRHEILSALAFLKYCELSGGRPITDTNGALAAAIGAEFIFADPSGEIDLAPQGLAYPLQLTAWLIATHHRLPDAGIEAGKSPQFRLTNHSNKNKLTGPVSIQLDPAIATDRLEKRARELYNAVVSLSSNTLAGWRTDSAYGRIALVLADHLVSRESEIDTAWHGDAMPANSALLANYTAASEAVPRLPKQTLEEHLFKVATQSRLTHSDLADWPDKAAGLPALSIPVTVKSRAKGRFAWQDDAADSVSRHSSRSRGFFACLIAGTGAGKTRAIPKIMAARGVDIRYSLALSLRSLTLQSGDDYYELGFDRSEVAVLIGDSAIQELHVSRSAAVAAKTGSSSAATLSQNLLFGDDLASQDVQLAVVDDGETITDRLAFRGGYRLPHEIGRHLPRSDYRAMERYLATPILISTIDQLMSAADGQRTSYIADALRLMSSDLVIDEADNFDAQDLVAIGRLVHLAGLFGRGVLISSATIPPAIAQSYFESYRAGYRAHASAFGRSSSIDAFIFTNEGVSTADRAVHVQDARKDTFSLAYRHVCRAMAKRLAIAAVLRRAVVLPRPSPISGVAPRHLVFESATRELADLHHSRGVVDRRTGCRLSMHLIKLSHVNSCGDYADWFTRNHARVIPENVDVKLVVYHARFPLLQRNHIEHGLDSLLRARHEDIFRRELPRRLMRDAGGRDTMIFVVATSVIETGRDYDFDGVAIEPSDMRSIIQCAGRLERHRLRPTEAPNFFILPGTLDTLDGKARSFPYSKPGPEGVDQNLSLQAFRLSSPWISDLVPGGMLSSITAASRLEEDAAGELAALEHRKLSAYLSGPSYYSLASFHGAAAMPFLTAPHPRYMRFRKSAPSLTLYLDPEINAFRRIDETERGQRSIASEIVSQAAETRLVGISLFAEDARTLLDQLAGEDLFRRPGQHSTRIQQLARRYLRVSIPASESSGTHYVYDYVRGVIRSQPS